MRARLVPCLAAGLLVAASTVAQGAPASVDPQCQQLLPPAEVEQLTGLKPLKLVGRFQVQYAGGTCNYVVGEDRLVLLFSVTAATPKSMEEFRAAAKWAGGAKPLAGLGTEALQANGSLAFVKSKNAVSVGSFMDPRTGAFFVPNDKLLALARVLEKKL